MATSGSTSSLPEITVCNGDSNGFIWSLDDANYLRSKHRILGNFHSAIPKHNEQRKKRKITDQTMKVAVPFLLNKFEMRLCFELNIASITHKCIDQHTFHCTDNHSNNKNANQHGANNNQQIHQFFMESNVKRIESLQERSQYQRNKEHIESTGIGQKRKLKETDVIENNQHQNQSSKQPLDELKELELWSTCNIVDKLSLHKGVHVSPSQQDFVLFPQQWFKQYVFAEICNGYNAAAFWSMLLNFEASSKQFAEFDEIYAIYRDLYDNGFYILLDRRFGGHFILYEQSPSVSSETKIHSRYVVQVMSQWDENYKSMMDVLDKYCTESDARLVELDIMIMCFVRIAVHVKKQLLFAYVDAETNNVKYYIIKWHYCQSNDSDNDNHTDKEMWYEVYKNYQLKQP